MAFLNFLSLAESIKVPGGLWELLILQVFDFIVNYGWRVLLFTVLLKLLLSPLDIYQRIMMRKNAKITKNLEPELEKLKKQYGDDKSALQQKQYQLNKKEGYSYFSSCLPALVTMGIFFYLFSGLNSISQYKNMSQYIQMHDIYNDNYNKNIVQAYDEHNDKVESLGTGVKITYAFYRYNDSNSTDPTDIKDEFIDDLDKSWADFYVSFLNDVSTSESDTDEQKKEKEDLRYSIQEILEAVVIPAQEEVYNAYYGKDKYEGKPLQENFLWVKNVWSPDVFWKKPILESDGFKKAVAKFGTDENKLGISNSELVKLIDDYDAVTFKLRNAENNKTNGLLILPILSVGFSFLSQFITQRLQKKSGQESAGGAMGNSMKMMMFAMPVMMGFFALSYTTAFTIYIVANSSMTILLNLVSSLIMKVLDKKDEREVVTDEGVVKYGRPDPNELKKNDKKKDRKKPDSKNMGRRK